MILPGATLGMLGGGQLGRMFTMAARTMGYRVVVLDPDPLSPAASLADAHLQAEYTDRAALEELARRCAAASTEFENVPADSLAWLEERIPVRPSSAAVAVAQHRIREKLRVREAGLDTAPFVAIRGPEDLAPGWERIGGPAMLKRATSGYDGKGQAVVHSLAESRSAWQRLGERPCVLEQRLELAAELSVVLARGSDGQIAFFPVARNVHRNSVLHSSRSPSGLPERVLERARSQAESLAVELDYVGVLAVEFFLDGEGRVRVNELAPRPHNSGHYTLDACAVSQFGQQVRALCGLPLADPTAQQAAAMVNLLGDLWQGGAPDWSVLFAHPRAHLHLYGKAEARPGRKMGHVTVLGEDPEHALAEADQLHAALCRKGED